LPGPDDTAEDTAFETYLRGELETYSDDTLMLLHRDVIELKKMGINGSQQIYEHLVKALGYDSIGAANQAQQQRLKQR
jgi:hypothetical protein